MHAPQSMSNPDAICAAVLLAQACDAVAFVEDELDEAIAEMAIPTELPHEVQRALMGRAMLSLSVAASVAQDEEFTRAIREVLAPVGELRNLLEPADIDACFQAMVERASRQVEAEMAGLPEFEAFSRRVADLLNGGGAAWSLH